MSAGSLGANAVSRGVTTSMPTMKRTANVGAAIGWPLDQARHD
ncbi:hypothetical protein PENARI_c219G01463 [Penicillium arizonense]|uniref:Uncharacterized protein n=1 Tax=Penicillium arizonense TaxID=1835702 RepID=A0A1F5KZV0_PENAI|nr:hypothetical protein PENARI_c219G01463 [Penicillium arizonense]OGE46508.1 hypothetical protein PENARI_c219G01463 [Penicillium arizonense]